MNPYERAALDTATKISPPVDTEDESAEIVNDDRPASVKKTNSKMPAAPMEKNDALLASKDFVATVPGDISPGKCAFVP